MDERSANGETKVKVGVLEAAVAELKGELREHRAETRADVKELSASLSGLHTKLAVLMSDVDKADATGAGPRPLQAQAAGLSAKQMAGLVAIITTAFQGVMELMKMAWVMAQGGIQK